MTTVHHAREAGGRPQDPTLESDLADLRRALAQHPFPTRQDDLIADCLGRHEPTRLVCRLSKVSRTATFASVDEVCAAVVAAVAEQAPSAEGPTAH